MRKLLWMGVWLFAAPAMAQFDWGGGGCSGSGSFQQPIAYRDVVVVGDIPAGKVDVLIELQSDNDVDIQLFDATDGTAIVEWPNGLLNGPGVQQTQYAGVTVEWSGYNGDGTGYGHEYILLTGTTDRDLTMKAYGYVAGSATVNYSWQGTAGCSDTPAASGSGSFQQQIAQNAVVVVGDLVPGIANVRIELLSDNDVDIQLFDATDGTAIVQWPNGLLNGATEASTSYQGVNITWSGYNGDGTGAGHEFIEIAGTLSRTLTMKAFGYAAGFATVNYSWGNSNGSDPWAAYYANAAGKTGTALKLALHDIIANNTALSYTPGVWDALKQTDEDPLNSNNVVLLYKQTSSPKSNSGGGVDNWNREHVWAKSHGSFGTSPGPGTDIHHLRPTDVTVNSARGNLDFDYGGSVVAEAPLCKVDGDSWEPPDVVKGDIARMLFYMVVRYEGGDGWPDLELVDATGTSGPQLGKLSTLLQWHQQDPVDDWERSRNDKIYQLQGNRNPFIDHPEWVQAIWP